MKFKFFLSAAIILLLILPFGSVMASDTNITFKDSPNPKISQTISLWNTGQIPSKTLWSSSASNPDGKDFMPNIISVPAAEGTKIKGAVMINPGGAFAFRSPAEGLPVAEELRKYGYQCFVVNYRLNPYTQEEAALDLARGIRYVRAHADDYGINPDNIATIGFSAGGILSGELALHFKGFVNGTVVDKSYIPDELDKISSDVAAVGLMYSFYGRLSVASTDLEKFRNANLPPTYVLYGSNEVFRNQIENQVALLKEAQVPTQSHILNSYSHGFGAKGNWFDDFDQFLSSVFSQNNTELLTINKPAIRGNEARISSTAHKDIHSINVLTALYADGILAAVHINSLEERFTLESNKTYMIKIYAWEKGIRNPKIESYKIDGIRAENTEMQTFLNNTLAGKDGNIHYTYYLPANYNASKSYPMLITLPGWSSKFHTIETTPLTENHYAKSNAEIWTALAGDMIVVSPSLTDWGDKSARQTIELTDYFINNFAVDTSRIYAAGFSAGGETMSKVLDMRPDLFAAYLHCASQWDGGYENVTKAKIPVYISMAQNDEYYGSQIAQKAYNGLKQAYENAGLTQKEIDELLVLDLKENSYFGSNVSSYHGGGYFIATDKTIIGWLLNHTKQEV